MNRTRIYTVISLAAALVFLLGSMAGMKFIMAARERQLLTQSGYAEVESPVRTWETLEKDGEKNGAAGYTLTMAQMEEVIINWETSASILLHNPVEGQLSMEEAIQCGEKWLKEMGFAQEKRISPRSVRAVLAVGDSGWIPEDQLAPYHSYWMVEFQDAAMKASLEINAVTGQVWAASVTQYIGTPEKLPGEALPLFIEMAGIHMDVAGSELVTSDGSRAYVKVEDSKLYGVVEVEQAPRGDIVVNNIAGDEMMVPSEETEAEYSIVTVTTLSIGADEI